MILALPSQLRKPHGQWEVRNWKRKNISRFCLLFMRYKYASASRVYVPGVFTQIPGAMYQWHLH